MDTVHADAEEFKKRDGTPPPSVSQYCSHSPLLTCLLQHLQTTEAEGKHPIPNLLSIAH